MTNGDTTGFTTTLNNTQCTQFVGSPGSNDGFWTFTTGAAGLYRFETCGTAFDTVLSVHSACQVDVGNSLACNDDSCGLQSAVQVNLGAAQTVYVRVGGYGTTGGGTGPVTLTISALGVPGACCISTCCIVTTAADCANVYFGTYTADGTTCAGNTCGVAAAGENCDNAFAAALGANGGDTSSNCGFDITTCAFNDNVDQWWDFTAGPAGGTYVFETALGSLGDTTLAIFDSCGGAQLACNDDFGGLQSRIQIVLGASQNVKVRVAGYNGLIGSYTLNISEFSPVDNDDCIATSANPAYALSVGVPVNGNNFGSTADAGDGSLCFATDSSVWYHFTPAVSGNYAIDLCSAGPQGFDSVLAVVPSCGAAALACDDDGCAFGFAESGIASISLTGGTQYMIRVRGFGGVQGNFTILVSVGPGAPANDECANAVALSLGVPAFGSNLGANTSFVVPDICGPFVGSGGAADIFYSFTPAVSGDYEVNTCGSAIDTVVAVYDACPPADPATPLICNDDAGLGACAATVQSAVNVTMTAGTTYYIRASSYGGGPQGAITVTVLNATPGPANDDCVVTSGNPAFALSVGVPVNGNNFASTADAGDLTGCTDVTASVWYHFTPAVSGNYSIDLCSQGPQGFDSVLSVIDNCGDAFLACDDDGCAFGFAESSISSVGLTAGTQYMIRVRGFGGVQGNFTILVSGAGSGPANDECANAAVASVGVNNGSSVGATTSVSLTGACTQFLGSGGSNDVFWSFTTAGGVYTFETCGTLFDTVLSVHSACPVSDGNALACNDDACGLQSQIVDLNLAAGTYYVRVAGYGTSGGPTGAITLTITSTTPATAACCVGNSPSARLCVLTDAADCANQGGSFLGGATTCVGIGYDAGNYNPQAPWTFGVPNNNPQAQAGCCVANFNNTGGVTVQDLYDYLTSWSASSGQCVGGPFYVASTDLTGDQCTTVQDLYDFLTAWSAGCGAP